VARARYHSLSREMRLLAVTQHFLLR
jgi:hypothetical protein